MDAPLTPKAAADMIGVKADTLKAWRYRKQGPRWVKIGSGPRGFIRYHREEVERWLVENTTAPDDG